MSCNEWNQYSLEEVIEKFIDYRGRTPKKVEKGIPLITAKVVKSGRIEETSEFIKYEDYDKWMTRGIPLRGDVVMTTEAPLGEVAQIETDEKIALAQRIITLRGKKDILDNTFLRYSLQSPIMQWRINSRASGTTVIGIKSSELKKVSIDLPPLGVQKDIAQILLSLDKKIELNNEMNKTLEDMAQALFKRWFVDFEFPNEDGKPYKSSGGEMVESELGMIPKGWCSKQLKDYIKFVKGKKPKVISEDKLENSKVYLTIDVLKRNSIQYAINDKVILADKKDVLMVMDGASAGSLFYGISGIVGSTLSSIVIINEILNCDILYYFLKYNEENIKGHLTGSAIPHTDKEYVNRLKICLPNDKRIITMITDIYSNIRSKVINNNEENMRLKELRDSLLPKLMSGEIKVKDIQANL